MIRRAPSRVFFFKSLRPLGLRICNFSPPFPVLLTTNKRKDISHGRHICLLFHSADSWCCLPSNVDRMVAVVSLPGCTFTAPRRKNAHAHVLDGTGHCHCPGDSHRDSARSSVWPRQIPRLDFACRV